ncbi:MAG: hypothetical protein IH959_01950 [Chloroflexi bacterium]|nr:hypothetical protein [Chloroflexota bacterium]
MIETLRLGDARHGLLLAAGLLLGLAVALATAGLSWQAGAFGLGLGLAALVGLAQTCSA